MKRHFPLLCIAIVSLLLYLPFVSNGYINVDDAGLIWNNSAVMQFDVLRVFSSYDPELYIPLTLLTYQIEYVIAGASPLLSHLTNLLLHTLSALLVYAIVKRLTRSATVGLLTALFFAMHPMQSTAVLWASARKDLLSSALMLLSLHLYLKENKWSLAAFLGALLSKISVAVLPLLLLLIDVWEGKPMNRERITEKWPYFGLSFVFGVIAIFGKTTNLGSMSSSDYFLLSAKNIVFSVQKLFAPLGLSFMYPQSTEVSVAQPDFYIPIILLMFAAGLLYALRKRLSVVVWCLGWFVICMLPNLLTYSQNTNIIFASNRYVYLACIGVFMYISSLIVLQKRAVMLVLIPVLLGTCGVLTVAETRTWRSSEALMRSSLAAGYDHPMIHHNLAAALRKSGKKEEAMQEFLHAGNSGYAYSFKLAGDMQKERGNDAKATKLYEQSMEAVRKSGARGSTDLAAHYEIAALRQSQNNAPEAERILLEALKLGDHIASTYINLGTLYLETGNADTAKKYLLEAVKLNSFSAGAWYHLAFVYAQEMQHDKAVKALKRVLRIDPYYNGAAANLEQLENL
ncbi:MAG: tetratricopeptide repeat protein [Candidatus Peribacter sp.]|nr:tetratricopeptide repeat protein [Candidatus Peribacter sp.]MBT4393484.1 tetratricopeptide repeat protein [Candidatus Peribacter sp.]MBT4600843.1 tetratricopeptide repeat protein [Candidatus Peribacter sp.]MBT5149490.1 tetratricopeptide repeat protein [Candidatus Peribacter sp.]MBT5938046.1 tetratricopeptide repeat protein [Candidatus Peribacter sp.]